MAVKLAFLGNIAEKGGGRIVPVQPGLRHRRRRVGRNEAGVAVRKGHNKKMRPPILDAGDDRIRPPKSA